MCGILEANFRRTPLDIVETPWKYPRELIELKLVATLARL